MASGTLWPPCGNTPNRVEQAVKYLTVSMFSKRPQQIPQQLSLIPIWR